MKKKLLLIFSLSLCMQPSWAQDISGFERVDHVLGVLKEQDFGAFKAFPVEDLDRLQTEKDLGVVYDYDRLPAEEIPERVIGNTVYGLTAKKIPYAIHFLEGRRAPTLMADGRFEVGKWDVNREDHRITSQWLTLHGGTPIRVEYHESRDGSHLLKVNPGTKKYTVMVLKKGDPEGLATRKA